MNHSTKLLMLAIVSLGSAFFAACSEKTQSVVVTAAPPTTEPSTAIIITRTKTPTPTIEPTPTPSPASTIQPLPPTSTSLPIGWIQYQNDEYGFSFEYPLAYEVGACGRITQTKENDHVAIEFSNSATVIRIFEGQYASLQAAADEYGQRLAKMPGYLMISRQAGELPAFEMNYTNTQGTTYYRDTFVLKERLLFEFFYSFNSFISCDAPDMSEEAVYEHILETLQFYPE